jgi:alpha-L-fucosidase
VGDNIVKPLERQIKWQDCEIGVVYHFDLPVYTESGWAGHERKPMNPHLYSPNDMDTDQWLEAAKALGAGYAIFTATHFNGFLQWQSDLYPYGVKQSKWRDGKGDVVKDFIDSCHKYKVKPGIYLSCHRNTYWKVDKHKVNWGEGGEDEQKEFNQICEKMVEELCSRYGELFQIWFDAGVKTPQEGGPDILPIVDKYQPNMVFYHSLQRAEHRWIGNEDGVAGYPCWATIPTVESQGQAHRQNRKDILLHGDPDGKAWSPGMCDMPLRDHDWFWKPNREDRIESLKTLVDCYYKSVGRNCNLMLGLTPDSSGLMPQPDVERLTELGNEIQRLFGKPLTQVQDEGEIVELNLNEPVRIDHVSIMEDITHGERVREYVIECLLSHDKWQKICEGISIGHKRIQQFKPVEVKAVRFRCIKSIAVPKIRSLSIFET